MKIWLFSATVAYFEIPWRKLFLYLSLSFRGEKCIGTESTVSSKYLLFKNIYVFTIDGFKRFYVDAAFFFDS